MIIEYRYILDGHHAAIAYKRLNIPPLVIQIESIDFPAPYQKKAPEWTKDIELI